MLREAETVTFQGGVRAPQLKVLNRGEILGCIALRLWAED